MARLCVDFELLPLENFAMEALIWVGPRGLGLEVSRVSIGSNTKEHLRTKTFIKCDSGGDSAINQLSKLNLESMLGKRSSSEME